jgi:acetyl-CoA carboxylase carboxyl transferase subunit alpha
MLIETRSEQRTAWDKVQIARHPRRPHTNSYIRRLCSSFVELRGDRYYADDQAIIGGVGQTALGSVVVVGHQKGSSARENVQHRFGMPLPEGFRKAQRLMQYAEKFAMPLVYLIDTPGAQPDAAAEERGQAQAIAQCLMTMARLETPIVSVVIGEGCSGGALALGVANRLLMLEHAICTVALPEACAAILWRDAGRALDAAAAMRITAQDLASFGMIDEIIPEPNMGAHTDAETTVAHVVDAIVRHLVELRWMSGEQLRQERYAKYRTIGCFQAASEQTLQLEPSTLRSERLLIG